MEQPPSPYNFSDLLPEVQHWLYKRICAFDLTCNMIAARKDEIVIAVRNSVHLRVAGTMDCDDLLNISRLETIATDHNLPKGAFNDLTPRARWTSLMWARAIETAAWDCWAATPTRENSAQVLSRVLSITDHNISKITPEQIADYWAFVDRWEASHPDSWDSDQYFVSSLRQASDAEVA